MTRIVPVFRRRRCSGEHDRVAIDQYQHMMCRTTGVLTFILTIRRRGTRIIIIFVTVIIFFFKPVGLFQDALCNDGKFGLETNKILIATNISPALRRNTLTSSSSLFQKSSILKLFYRSNYIILLFILFDCFVSLRLAQQ